MIDPLIEALDWLSPRAAAAPASAGTEYVHAGELLYDDGAQHLYRVPPGDYLRRFGPMLRQELAADLLRRGDPAGRRSLSASRCPRWATPVPARLMDGVRLPATLAQILPPGSAAPARLPARSPHRRRAGLRRPDRATAPLTRPALLSSRGSLATLRPGRRPDATSSDNGPAARSPWSSPTPALRHRRRDQPGAGAGVHARTAAPVASAAEANARLVVLGADSAEHDAEDSGHVSSPFCNGSVAELPDAARSGASRSPASARLECCSTRRWASHSRRSSPGSTPGPRASWTGSWTDVGFERLHRITGLCADPTFSLAKLLW